MDPLRTSDPARIAGHRLLGRLGEGGMGVVYLARSAGGALIALKVVRGEYADDTGFRARFRREVAVARRVTGPWTVRLVDAAPDAEEPWLATEFVPGPSLAEAVGRHGPFPVRGLRVLGARLAEALHGLHEAGLVHRDLKPGNVLLAPDGPRLIDFGIARAPDDTSLTADGVVVGTPGYLPPEQAGGPAGVAAGPAGDVFSLGCVLVYAATGRPPFGTGPVDALLYRAVHDAPDTAGVPGELAHVLETCLEKDPASRPAARDLARGLAGDAARDPAGGPDADASPFGQLDEVSAPWLPEPVVQLIAQRSAAALDLPDVDDTELCGTSEPAPGPKRSPAGTAEGDSTGRPDRSRAGFPPASGRRRFLAATGGAVLLAAGGATALWAAARDGSAPPEARPGKPRPTIALHGDLSGPDKETGRAQERGLRLAVEQFNARPGRPLTLAVRAEDDGGDPAAARRIAERLAGDPAVLAVVGPTTDATAEAALAAYDTALLPVVAVSPGANTLSLQGYRSFCHARVTDTVLAFYLNVYLRGVAASRRVGIVQDRAADHHGWEIGSTLSKLLHEDGHPQVPKVVSALRRDFRPPVDTLLAAGADSVVFAGRYERAALAAKVLHDRRFTGARAAAQAILDTRFLTAAGDAAEGWLAVAPVADPTALPAGAAFTAAYERRFGGPPPRYAAEAYDATGMVLAGIGGLKTSRPTRRGLLAAVRGTPYQGVVKKLAFKKDTGELVIGADNGVFLWRVERGDFRCRGPAPVTVPT
ncbi:bifunctional serine/threonine-protein kinase/ABC transporter substrate-binding protein [Streptomyces lavendofoliae]|uniref:bifunctional serine/threonine-protein kinase/ABC transporter substrate-binding protein n=1 Tax=Streptomyces lavendofoliae TaxID=67314 RepID=UPI003D8E48DB